MSLIQTKLLKTEKKKKKKMTMFENLDKNRVKVQFRAEK
jgi:hypothetical protein